ncbi:hypothetical protein [Actinomyces urogenitalis]|uniref:hypothetical protein n=1 Tax=Actinomyces urogenitalis TaxID=103621 RepID=UPI00050E9A11|nr:hypothetical protein [Actinomyces urogenitalis]KGF04821.1 hypothetical protein HMPREF1626_00845 [Actinomyces urogenitalis S6-C4]MDU5426797.1 hypothetical protein [Actinomyces urogenitalis]MDU5875278.1 hypothetical protein [Actinomyces urogenitalis]
MDPLELPVSVVLALWAPLPSSFGAATVQGPDGAHTVLDAGPCAGDRLAGGAAPDAEPVALEAWLRAARPLRHCAAVLPSPADPVSGLALALEAGQGVLVEGGASSSLEGRTVLLVPYTSGTSVTWWAHALAASPPPFDASQARRQVHAATEEAIRTLTELDLARERPELAELLTDLVTAVLDPRLVPPSLDARRRDLLERSLRLAAVCELALDDDGAAASAREAGRRHEVLRRLLVTARRGASAATETWGR